MIRRPPPGEHWIRAVGSPILIGSWSSLAPDYPERSRG